MLTSIRSVKFKRPHTYLLAALTLETINVRRILENRTELIKHHDAGKEAENQGLDEIENREDGFECAPLALHIVSRGAHEADIHQ